MVLKAPPTYMGKMTSTSWAFGRLCGRNRWPLSVFSNHNELMVLTSDVTFGSWKSEGYLSLYERPRRDLLQKKGKGCFFQLKAGIFWRSQVRCVKWQVRCGIWQAVKGFQLRHEEDKYQDQITDSVDMQACRKSNQWYGSKYTYWWMYYLKSIFWRGKFLIPCLKGAKELASGNILQKTFFLRAV